MPWISTKPHAGPDQISGKLLKETAISITSILTEDFQSVSHKWENYFKVETVICCPIP